MIAEKITVAPNFESDAQDQWEAYKAAVARYHEEPTELNKQAAERAFKPFKAAYLGEGS